MIIMNDSFFLEETSKNFASASVTFCMVENSIKNLEKVYIMFLIIIIIIH